MENLQIPRVLSILALGVAGCGSQAGTGYHGEPLLSVTGRVILESGVSSTNLVPALAWGSVGKNLLIRDVDVSGQFPASFSIDVFEPPPAEAMAHPDPTRFPGEPALALGYITAVPPDHPDTISSGTWRASATNGPCGTTGCEQTSSYCASDGVTCYEEVKRCDTNGENCTIVSTTGDPKLKQGVLGQLPGLSENYAVLYLAGDARPGGFISYFFGEGKPVAAGYHLLAVEPLSPEEAAAVTACEGDATSRAWARYDAGHGTSYMSIGDVPAESLDAVQNEFSRLELELQQELGCAPSTLYRVTLVGDASSRPITVRIGPDVKAIDIF